MSLNLLNSSIKGSLNELLESNHFSSWPEWCQLIACVINFYNIVLNLLKLLYILWSIINKLGIFIFIYIYIYIYHNKIFDVIQILEWQQPPVYELLVWSGQRFWVPLLMIRACWTEPTLRMCMCACACSSFARAKGESGREKEKVLIIFYVHHFSFCINSWYSLFSFSFSFLMSLEKANALFHRFVAQVFYYCPAGPES